MSVFTLPKKLCKNLSTIMAQFWWCTKNKERSIYWRKWEKLGDSKEWGGLCFRDIECFNKALRAKQIWRVIKNTCWWLKYSDLNISKVAMC